MAENNTPTAREAAHGQVADDPTIRDSRVTTDDAPGAEQRSFQTRPGDSEPVPPNPEGTGERFDPSPVQAARTREKGNGVGQRELDLQRDAAPDITEDQMSNDPDPGRAQS
jgi:hypothetical protein